MSKTKKETKRNRHPQSKKKKVKEKKETKVNPYPKKAGKKQRAAGGAALVGIGTSI